MARPGRRPLLIPSPAIGARTDVDSTSTTAPPSKPALRATAVVRRTEPRKTDSKAERHCSSLAS